MYDRATEWPKEARKSSSAEGDALRRWFRRISPEKRREARSETDSEGQTTVLVLRVWLPSERFHALGRPSRFTTRRGWLCSWRWSSRGGRRRATPAPATHLDVINPFPPPSPAPARTPPTPRLESILPLVPSHSFLSAVGAAHFPPASVEQGYGYFFVDLEMPAAVRSRISVGVSADFTDSDADLPCVLFRRSRGLLDRLGPQRTAEAMLESQLRVSFSEVAGVSADTGVSPAVVSVSLEACEDADALLAAFDELSWRVISPYPQPP